MIGFGINRKKKNYSRVEQALLNSDVISSLNAKAMVSVLNDYSQYESFSKELEKTSNYFKQVNSQKEASERILRFFSSNNEIKHFYKASLKSEIRKRVYEISKEIGGDKYYKEIIKDIEKIIDKEKSNYLCFNDFIRKLYIKVVIKKRFKRSNQKLHKIYCSIIHRLIRGQLSIQTTLILKNIQNALKNILKTVLKKFNNIELQLPLKFILKEYYDIVHSPKEYILGFKKKESNYVFNNFKRMNHERGYYRIIEFSN